MSVGIYAQGNKRTNDTTSVENNGFAMQSADTTNGYNSLEWQKIRKELHKTWDINQEQKDQVMEILNPEKNPELDVNRGMVAEMLKDNDNLSYYDIRFIASMLNYKYTGGDIEPLNLTKPSEPAPIIDLEKMKKILKILKQNENKTKSKVGFRGTTTKGLVGAVVSPEDLEKMKTNAEENAFLRRASPEQKDRYNELKKDGFTEAEKAEIKQMVREIMLNEKEFLRMGDVTNAEFKEIIQRLEKAIEIIENLGLEEYTSERAIIPHTNQRVWRPQMRFDIQRITEDKSESKIRPKTYPTPEPRDLRTLNLGRRRPVESLQEVGKESGEKEKNSDVSEKQKHAKISEKLNTIKNKDFWKNEYEKEYYYINKSSVEK
jgi:DNA-directed RNA polymerase subunit N (RpoN/RPB10)